jgi:hypothetical protein
MFAGLNASLRETGVFMKITQIKVLHFRHAGVEVEEIDDDNFTSC